jgi:hypothetical protein
MTAPPLTRHFLAFTSPDDVYSATQYQFGVKSSDVCGLPLLARDWPFESPNLNSQCVIQRQDSKDRIFEHDFVARRTPARPHYKPYAQVRF